MFKAFPLKIRFPFLSYETTNYIANIYNIYTRIYLYVYYFVTRTEKYVFPEYLEAFLCVGLSELIWLILRSWRSLCSFWPVVFVMHMNVAVDFTPCKHQLVSAISAEILTQWTNSDFCEYQLLFSLFITLFLLSAFFTGAPLSVDPSYCWFCIFRCFEILPENDFLRFGPFWETFIETGACIKGAIESILF